VALVLTELEFRDQLLVFLDAGLGTRRGELGALRWMDCDFNNRSFDIQHSYYWRRGGHLIDTKSEASAQSLPMHPGLKEHAVMALRSGPAVGPTVLNVLAGVVGILLLVGLWTPVAGAMLAILAGLSAVLHPADPWNCIFLGALGAALALVGPGAWSVDAYLFGWKRI